MKHELRFDAPIGRWDEAIPLGCGLVGCLIYGDGAPLRFSLDRGDLWDTRAAPEWQREDCTYEELVRLVAARDQDAIDRRFADPNVNHPSPTKIPAGRIELDYGAPCDAAESRLSLVEATAYVTLAFGGRCSEVRSYLHATSRTGFISIRGSAPAPDVRLFAHVFTPGAPGAVESQGRYEIPCWRLDYPPPEFGRDGPVQWFAQRTREATEFGIVTASVKTADGLEIAYAVVTNRDSSDWLESAKRRVLEAARAGFESSRSKHLRWWERFWGASSVSLPDQDAERQWYLNNYLFGSCSRKGAPPMPLQGVWTADTGMLPPWKGDYHNDLNTQMSYQHFAGADHLEEGESFIDFLWNLRDAGREFARRFYDAPGLCLPGVMSIAGQPLGGWPMYTLSMTNHLWLCKSFVDYWRATGDPEFLAERAYPYLKESAECILRWLGSDGRLPLSSSPEIHNNTLQAWLTPNSNYDLALLRYLFGSLADLAATLGDDQAEFWRGKLAMLPELAVNARNVLMLSPNESLSESHRHHSHALAIYPLMMLDRFASVRDRQIIDATIANMQALGTGAWCGYSFAWMAGLYAIQGNGEGAAYQLKLFRECFCSDNGFHLNGDFRNRGLSAGHSRPFTLEGNMCAADALQQMLLASHNSVVRVFPAVPEDWKRQGISFTDLRAEGGVRVSAEMQDGRLEWVRLGAERDALVRLHRSTSAGDAAQIVDIRLSAGEQVTLNHD